MTACCRKILHGVNYIYYFQPLLAEEGDIFKQNLTYILNIYVKSRVPALEVVYMNLETPLHISLSPKP